MTLFQDSLKAEDELHQIFQTHPEDVSPVKLQWLLFGMYGNFHISMQLTVEFITKTGIFLTFRME